MPDPKHTHMTLNVDGVPRALVEAVRLKAKAEMPARSLKWKLVELMARYVSTEEAEVPPEAETPEPARRRKRRAG